MIQYRPFLAFSDAIILTFYNIFVDVSRTGLFANDYDGRPFLLFHMVGLIRNYINTFI